MESQNEQLSELFRSCEQLPAAIDYAVSVIRHVDFLEFSSRLLKGKDPELGGEIERALANLKLELEVYYLSLSAKDPKH